MSDFPDWDWEAELEKAHATMTFRPVVEGEVFISGDKYGKKDFSWHVNACRGLIVLCEMLDLRVAGLAMYGSSPAVLIDILPSSGPLEPGKFGKIVEFTGYLRSQDREATTYTPEFDITLWLAPLGITVSAESGYINI